MSTPKGSDVLMFLAGIAGVILVMWFFMWVGKNLSYWLFYEDLVRETITEMVKEGSLIKGK